jgi:hypothetical protein
LNRLRAIYDSEGMGKEFILPVLEDRELLGVTRIRNTDGWKMWVQLTHNLGMAGYVQRCCWDAALGYIFAKGADA